MLKKVASSLICPACAGEGRSFEFEGLLECTRCGHAWLPEASYHALQPSGAAALYDPGYFNGGDYGDYAAERPLLEQSFRRHCQRMLQVVPRGGRILELGSAFGYFLDVAKDHFEVVGFDVSEEVTRASRSRGHRVYHGSMVDMKEPDHSFDAICLWDTIEHLLDPRVELAAVSRLLKPGGHLFLTTGDRSSLLARLQGKHWRHYHPPTHVHYFTRASVQKMLECFGGQVERIWTVWPMHSVGYILGGLEVLGRGHFLKSLSGMSRSVVPKSLLRLPIPVPTGDIMGVCARWEMT